MHLDQTVLLPIECCKVCSCTKNNVVNAIENQDAREVQLLTVVQVTQLTKEELLPWKIVNLLDP